MAFFLIGSIFVQFYFLWYTYSLKLEEQLKGFKCADKSEKVPSVLLHKFGKQHFTVCDTVHVSQSPSSMAGLASFDLIPSRGLQQCTQTRSHFLPQLVIPRYELFGAILGDRAIILSTGYSSVRHAGHEASKPVTCFHSSLAHFDSP